MCRLARLLVALPFLAACLLPPALSAQSLTIGDGSVRRDESVDIPVRFDPGPAPVAGFNLRVVYDRSRLGAPVCSAHLGAGCSVNAAAGHVTLIHVDLALAPLPGATYATLRFPVGLSATRGTSLLGARFIDFASPSAHAVDGTIHTGRVAIR